MPLSDWKRPGIAATGCTEKARCFDSGPFHLDSEPAEKVLKGHPAFASLILEIKKIQGDILYSSCQAGNKSRKLIKF
jgi:hypothetical protein